MRQIPWILSIAVVAAGLVIARGAEGQSESQPQTLPGHPTQSPASRRPQKTVTPQTYSIQQIQAGQLQFSSQCGFCHGRDAAGGETGPDLTRSKLVTEDNRGDKIRPLVRRGRPEQGMPAFSLSDAELAAIVAFIHDQKTRAETLGGGRRSVDAADLAIGDAIAGSLYFNRAGGCSACHSATGDLAGIASRYQGLVLLRRMLYPSGRPAPAPPEALSAHFDQLAKYTDDDMHNVYAYLLTLK